MAVGGQNSLTIRKRDLENEKTISVGFSKLQAWHKASAGETGIDLLALNFPSEITGATNPSITKLSSAQLRKFAKNLTVTSTLSGVLMREISYTIPNATRINFKGFTAAEDEIFEIVLDHEASTDLTVVDGKPISTTGTLAANTTDINVGAVFEVGKNINSQLGLVHVDIDGVLQLRNSGNSSTILDGNYYEVDPGGGAGIIIRMNVPDTSDRAYAVTSNGVIAERPIVSQQADIEKVQGQVDAMIPDLAQATGNPETNYQVTANNIDLKQFGDTVTELTQILDVEIETEKVAYLSDHKSNGTNGGTFTAGAWQPRILNTLTGDTTFVSLSNGTTGTDGTANYILLDPGDYKIRIEATAQTSGAVNLGSHKARLENLSTASTAVLGQNASIQAGFGSTTLKGNANVEGEISIVSASAQTLQVQHRCEITLATIGFGRRNSFGVDEIYTTMTITKIEKKTIREILGL